MPVTVREFAHLRSPITPGAGALPPELAGRTGVIEDGRVLAGRSLQGVVYSPEYGAIAYTVPMFADYLKRTMRR